ncbi:alpha-hydroxy acid oxidase [Pseudomonas sp. HR96]|uniref:alpha-hydroxy acid oxidase n=1 Tax=Pseudomonas sp. HR96 TaxID=1027966 RepID=UPI002A762887|nr:alpha-hydroxy acid oxidase [Pseudomonas sp. HR96]WPP02006.1 alpha-hydroxy acid oxidase [Pseudomonas sp. HR96]
MRRYHTGNDLARVQSIPELADLARRLLPHFVWEYLAGGAEEEITLTANGRDFERLGLCPRTLRGVHSPQLDTILSGRPSALPLAIAPTGYNAMLRRDADLLLARAATAKGVPFCLSTVSTSAMEQIVEQVPDVNLWLQLYCLRDPKVQEDLLKRAERLQVSTLLLTSDATVLGNREWDRRNFVRPQQLTLRNKLDVLGHPRWMLNTLWPRGMPSLGNLNRYLPREAQNAAGAQNFLGNQMDTALDWQALARLRERWSGLLILKGVLHPADAERALALGLDGIVVTNHGGRQLDGSPSSISVLPTIAAAVKGRMQILLDSGVRRGSDIVKAMALGADGVLVGRATLFGVAVGGQAGAQKALQLLADELRRSLILLGCEGVGELAGQELIRY